MKKSSIPSPARSQGALVTPRRYKPRRTKSVGSPARSTASGRLSTLVQQFKDDNMDSFAMSSLDKGSILNDNTDIEEPRRKSWWKRLDDKSRDIMEVIQTNKIDEHEVNDIIEEYVDMEVLSQEKKNFTIDMPESSGSESIDSIVLPQRKLFTQPQNKENQPQQKFGKVLGPRESLAKLQKTIMDKSVVNVGPKKLFNQAPQQRTKIAFPSALLNISNNKTIPNEEIPNIGPKKLFGEASKKSAQTFPTQVVPNTVDNVSEEVTNVGSKKLFGQQERPKIMMPAELLAGSPNKTAGKTKDVAGKTQVRSLFGNNPGTKRKNMFANFIASESEEELPEAQPKLFGFHRKSEIGKRRPSSMSARGFRDISPTSSITTDIELDDWRMLPSSTMMDQLEDMVAGTPKKLKLSKLHEHKETGDSGKLNKINSNKSNNTSKSPKSSDKNKTLSQSNRANKSQENKSDHAVLETPEVDGEPQMDISAEMDNTLVPETPKKLSLSNLPKEKDNTIVNTSKSSTPNNGISAEMDNTLVPETPKKLSLSNLPKEKDNTIVNTSKSSTPNNGNKSQRSLKNRSQNNISKQADTLQSQEFDANNKTKPRDEKELNNSNKELVQENKKTAEIEDEKPENSNEDITTNQENNKEKSVEINASVIDEQLAEQDEEQASEEENKTIDEEENNGEISAIDDEVEAVLEEEEDEEVVEEEEEEESEDEIVEEEQEQENDESQEVNHENDSQLMEENENDSAVLDQDEHDENVEEQKSHSHQIDHELSQHNELETDQIIVKDKLERSNQNFNYEKAIMNQITADVKKDIDDDQNNEGEENEAVENENEEEEEAENENEYVDTENEDQEEVEMQEEELVLKEDSGSDEEVSMGNDASAELPEEYNEDDEVDNNQEETDNNGDEEQEIDKQNAVVEETVNEPNTEDEIQQSPNLSHDTTGRHRKRNATKIQTPEAILREKDNKNDSFQAKGRNTSFGKTKSMIRPSKPPSLSLRESIDTDGSDFSAQGSGWDSHRTTRKTLRQTFGKDFTPRKSLRALVMEKSAKRHTLGQDLADSVQVPQANSTEINHDENTMPNNVSDIADLEDPVDESGEQSSPDASKKTRQTTLEMFLQKVKKDTMDRKIRMEKAVKQSLTAPSRDFLDQFNLNAKPRFGQPKAARKEMAKPKAKASAIPLGKLPHDLIEELKYKPPKRFTPNNASWITKRLYKFLESKLEPKYEYKARVRAEKLVETMYNFSQYIKRHDVAPRDAIDELKTEMARLNIVETHFEFYNFFHDFMPREVRLKVIPDIRNKLPVPKHGVFANILRENHVRGC